MSHVNQPPDGLKKTTPAENSSDLARKKRLAMELRANLKRRKTQQKLRQEGEGSPAAETPTGGK